MVPGRQVKAQAQAGAWAEFRDKAKAEWVVRLLPVPGAVAFAQIAGQRQLILLVSHATR